MSDRPSWDRTFIDVCHVKSRRSKDMRTQVGAVIVGPDNEIRSTGYNCFPRGIDDDVPERQVRPEKYKWFVHAEANAIFNAARMGVPLKGCSIYVPWHPCNTCMQAIIQSGITEVIIESDEFPDRWADLVRVSQIMAQEAGIVVRLPEEPNG